MRDNIYRLVIFSGLHERGTLPVSWMDFIGIKPGTHTEIHVSMEYRKRLTAPHSNCVDYDNQVLTLLQCKKGRPVYF